jgi:hypothetical protein
MTVRKLGSYEQEEALCRRVAGPLLRAKPEELGIRITYSYGEVFEPHVCGSACVRDCRHRGSNVATGMRGHYTAIVGTDRSSISLRGDGESPAEAMCVATRKAVEMAHADLKREEDAARHARDTADAVLREYDRGIAGIA